MKKFIPGILILAIATVPLIKPAAAFYTGTTNTEAELHFTHRVEFSSQARSKSALEDAAWNAVLRQLKHMHGPMSRSAVKAAPRGDDRISGMRVIRSEGNTYTAEYTFRGTVALQNGEFDTYSFPLPINPYTIYSSSRVTGAAKPFPCTDPTYTSEGDFWYFWSPERKGCQLVEGRDYTTVAAQVERLESRPKTLPDYERLVRNGEINISVLIAPDHDDRVTRKDPLKVDDLGATIFQKLRKALLAGGYQESRYTAQERGEFLAKKRRKPFVRKFTKSTRRAKIIIRVLYGSVSESPKDFHYTFKDALENDSIVIYSGHSGLGGNLNLNSIESQNDFKIQPPLDQYQIYFFNGCSTYTYYNSQYFMRKGTDADPQGSANLDILTNGLATSFGNVWRTTILFIATIDQWAVNGKLTSYADLVRKFDSRNLFGVNGDQDNPVQPHEISLLESIQQTMEIPVSIGSKSSAPAELQPITLPPVELLSPVSEEEMLRDIEEIEALPGADEPSSIPSEDELQAQSRD